MANIANLKSLSTSEARERGTKGGIASGEARQKRKALRQAYETIAGMPYLPVGDLATEIMENFKKVSDGREMTVDEAIVMAQIVKAANGDTAAAVFIRDTIGEKHAEVIDATVKVSLQGDIDEYAL